MTPAKPASHAPRQKTIVNSRETPDAGHPRHRRVVDAGADHGAEPRPVDQQPEAGREDDRR